MTTYRDDVEYIGRFDLGLVERNAAEFGRIGDVLESVEPSIARANNVVWESLARGYYETRLKDAKALAENLAIGMRAARSALLGYVDQVEAVRADVRTGDDARTALDERLGLLWSREPSVFGRVVEIDPMRRFEAITHHSPEVAGLVEEARLLYHQADEAYGRARSGEQQAHTDCLTGLRAAQAALPDFRGQDFSDAHNVVAGIAGMQEELAQARTDVNHNLSGSGVKDYTWPTDPDDTVSTKLDEINRLAAGQQAAREGTALNDSIPVLEREWIRNNKALIADVAARSGLPPAMIAAILLKEIDDKIGDDIGAELRRLGLYSGDRDETSFGPMQIQVRRAADVLGYDPENLTGEQRDVVVSALKDPVRSLYIAAEYMERLKASSEFASVPADEMEDKHYRELAERYNGGTDWPNDHATAYGNEFMRNALDDAKEAVR